jgi:hypothetical protein
VLFRPPVQWVSLEMGCRHTDHSSAFKRNGLSRFRQLSACTQTDVPGQARRTDFQRPVAPTPLPRHCSGKRVRRSPCSPTPHPPHAKSSSGCPARLRAWASGGERYLSRNSRVGTMDDKTLRHRQVVAVGMKMRGEPGRYQTRPSKLISPLFKALTNRFAASYDMGLMTTGGPPVFPSAGS